MAKSDMKKNQALAALLESSSISEAAEKAGISRRTMYNYLHEDIDFARAYKALQEEAATLHLERLEQNRERAAAVMLELMEDKQQPGAVRLKAAQAIVEAATIQAGAVEAIASRNVNRNKDMFDMRID